MLERLKTAIPLIILLALAFLLPGKAAPILFVLIAAVMLSAACHEMFTMASIVKSSFQWCTTLAAVLLVGIAAFAPRLHTTKLEITITACFLLAIAFVMFKKGPDKASTDAFLRSTGIFMYVVWPLLFIVKLYFLDGFASTYGRNLLVYMVAVTKMADVGAYFLGASTAKLPGENHKLAPRLSPKKSWEGLLGGTLFSTATAVILACSTKITMINGICINLWEAVAIGVLASVVGLAGDLMESAFKRAAGIKDSGNIPGIGGIMDVLDSLIPVAPLFYAFLLFKQ